MAYFLQYVYFLEYFSARILIFYIDFVDALDCHIFTGKFVNAERDFAESSLAQQFDKPIKLQRCMGYLPMLLHVGLNISNQFLSFLSHRVIQDHFLLRRYHFFLFRRGVKCRRRLARVYLSRDITGIVLESDLLCCAIS